MVERVCVCVAEYVCARKDVGFSAAAVVLKDEGDFEVCTKKRDDNEEAELQQHS